jgi:MscS family membrane protein
MHFVAILLALSPIAADAPDVKNCVSPKVVVAQFLEGTDGAHPNLARAASCAEIPPGATADEVGDVLARLRRVMNARGISVRLDEIPDDPNYRDDDTGFARVALSSRLPEIVVVRAGDAWLFPATTVEHTNSYFREAFPLDLSRVVETLPGWARIPVFGIAAWQVLLLAVLFILGWLIRLVITQVFMGQLKRLLVRTGAEWGETVLKGVSLPIGNLALAAVLALGIPTLQLGVQAALVLFLAVRVLAAVSVVMLLYRAVDLLGYWLSSKAALTDSKLDDQLVPIARRALKVVTIVIGVIFVLQNLDVDVTSLLTGLGLGGLAFALAAKDVVSNFFGSVTIFLDKPFQIGDWVHVSGVEGAVEEVGIRSTRIRTFKGSLVTVPNGKFTEAFVDNFGMRKFRRTTTTLSITYDTTPAQVEAFCAGVRAILKSHPTVRQEAYDVHFSEYGDSGLGILVSYHSLATSWSDDHRVRHEIYLDIWRLAEKLAVRFAFPTTTVHVESAAQPTEAFAPERPSLDDMNGIVLDFAPGGRAVIAPGPRGVDLHLAQKP